MPRIRNEETTQTQYREGDIVWVKINNSEIWWPGEVTSSQDFRFVNAARPPFAVVAFFNERTFEVVKTSKLIYPFNCLHKLELIARGTKKSENLHLKAKFCDDVVIAESRALELAHERAVAAARPDTLIKALISSNSSNRPGTDSSTPSIAAPASSSSSLTSSAVGNESTFRIMDIGSSDRQPRTGVGNYKCATCEFSTQSMSVLLIHRRAHLESLGVRTQSHSNNSSTSGSGGGGSHALLRATRRANTTSNAGSCLLDPRRLPHNHDAVTHGTSVFYRDSMRCQSRHVSIVVDASMTDEEQQQVASIAEITMASIERVVQPYQPAFMTTASSSALLHRRSTQYNERSQRRQRGDQLRSTMPAPEPPLAKQRRLTRSMSRRQQDAPEAAAAALPRTPSPLPPPATRRASRRPATDRRQTLTELSGKTLSPPPSGKRSSAMRKTMTATRLHELSPSSTSTTATSTSTPLYTPASSASSSSTPKLRHARTRTRSRLPTPPPPPPLSPPPVTAPRSRIDLERPEASTAEIADEMFEDEAPLSLQRHRSSTPLHFSYAYDNRPKPKPKPKAPPVAASEEQCAASLELQQSLLAEWYDDMDEPLAVVVDQQPAAVIINGNGDKSQSTDKDTKQPSGGKRKQRSRSSSSGTTVQTKKRIRNIPKKDRRDVVLQQFDVAVPACKPTAAEFIIIQDSDASSNESVVFVEAEAEAEAEQQPKPKPAKQRNSTASNAKGTEAAAAAAVEQKAVAANNNSSSCFDFAEEDEEVLPAHAQLVDGQNGLSYRRRMKSSCASVATEVVATAAPLPNGQNDVGEPQNLAEDEEKMESVNISYVELFKGFEEEEWTPAAAAAEAELECESKLEPETEPDQMSLPIKERQKRIFKSRNKSLQSTEQTPLASCSLNVQQPQQLEEPESSPMTPSDEATCSSLGKDVGELMAPLTPLTERNSTPTLVNGDSSNSSHSNGSRKPLHTKTEQCRRRRQLDKQQPPQRSRSHNSKSKTPLPYAELELHQPSPISEEHEELSNNSLESSSSNISGSHLSSSTSCSIASNIAVISAEEARELQRSAPSGALGHHAAIIDATRPVQRGGVLILENIRLPNLYERPFSREQTSSLLSETDSRDSSSKQFMSSSASDATVLEQEEHNEPDEVDEAEEAKEERQAEADEEEPIDADPDSDQEIQAEAEEEHVETAAADEATVDSETEDLQEPTYEISDLDVSIELDQSVNNLTEEQPKDAAYTENIEEVAEPQQLQLLQDSPKATSPNSVSPPADREEDNWQDWNVLEAAEMGSYVATVQEVPLKKREQELLRKYEADLVNGRSAEKCRKVRERWSRMAKGSTATTAPTSQMTSSSSSDAADYDQAQESQKHNLNTNIASEMISLPAGSHSELLSERRTASQTLVGHEGQLEAAKSVSSRSCDALRCMDPAPLTAADMLIAQQQLENLRAERRRMASMPMPLQRQQQPRNRRRSRNVASENGPSAFSMSGSEVVMQTQAQELPPQPVASARPESPLECIENPPAIAGLQQHQLGAGRICAVMTRPIPGYNHTFMLCSLANNNFTPLNSVALYLDSEKNHLVPVPREALTESPRLADGHPVSAVFADIDFLGGEAAMPQVVDPNTFEQSDELASPPSPPDMANHEAGHDDSVVVVADDDVNSDVQLIDISPLDAATEATVAAAGFYATSSAAAAGNGLALSHTDVDDDGDGDGDVVEDVRAMGNGNVIGLQDDDEHMHPNILLLTVNGHRLELEPSVLISIAQQPDSYIELNVAEGGRVVLHGSDILQAAQEYLQERDLQLVNVEEMTVDDDDAVLAAVVPHTTPATDLLAEALASSDVVSASAYMSAAAAGDALLHIGHGVVDVDNDNDDDDAADEDDDNDVGDSDGNGVVFISHTLPPPPHLTPPITARTNETSALLNQTPIMSTLESPSAVQIRRVSPLTTNHANLEDSLAIIGVTSGHGSSSGVPTSLELPITVTNPAIAPRVAAPAADIMPAFGPFP